MLSRIISIAALAVAAAIVTPLSAQRVATAARVQIATPPAATAPLPVAAPRTTVAGPTQPWATRADAAVGVRPIARESTPAPVPAPFREESSRNVAMMIVGGAGLLVGAVVGGKSGTIIMIGGGIVGLFGLWGYLK